MKRRSFLKLGGGVAAAAALPPVLGTTAPHLFQVGDVKAFFDEAATVGTLAIVYRVWDGRKWVDIGEFTRRDL